MAYNNYQQAPFWDFVRGLDTQNGEGVNHQTGSSFAPQPEAHGPDYNSMPVFRYGGYFGGGRDGFGAGSRCDWVGRGRHGRHGGPHEKRRSRGTTKERGTGENHAQGEPVEYSACGQTGAKRCGRHGRRGHSHSDAEHSEGEPDVSPQARHNPRGSGRDGRGGPHGCRGWGGYPRVPPPFPTPFGCPGGFDMNGLLAALSNDLLAQNFHSTAQAANDAAAGQQRSGETRVPENDEEGTFIPQIDIFSTEDAYVLHVALPGAKKEDVGVNWDDVNGVLNVAGVVYRQGDEAFLQTLAQSERKVGVFERSVKLPPGDVEMEEVVDGDMITAKMENGVLFVVVPKAEKEWTEVRYIM